MQTQEGPALVSFRSVQKSYDGETLIVKDLNPDVKRGEFLTLLGPSVSGKTTCLMLLAEFETPTAGQILMDGQLLNTKTCGATPLPNPSKSWPRAQSTNAR